VSDPRNRNPVGSGILSQIEKTSDYHPPGRYSLGGGWDPSFLTFFKDLSVTADPQTGGFIPLSGAGKNPKRFVVGVLPPIQNITGRVLDRSQTASLIANPENPFENLSVPTSTPEGVVTAPGYQMATVEASGSFRSAPDPGNDASLCNDGELAWTNIDGKMVANGKVDSRGVPTSVCSRSYSPAQVYRALGEAYVRVHGVEPTPVELQFYTAQCLRETSGFLQSNNFGQIGNRAEPNSCPECLRETKPCSCSEYAVEYSHRGGTLVRYFNSYATLEEGSDAYVRLITKRNPNVRESARNGDALGYVTSLAQQGYFQEPVSVYYRNMPRYLDRVAKDTSKYGINLPSSKSIPNEAPDVPGFEEGVLDYQARVKDLGLSGEAALFRFNEGSPYGEGALPTNNQPVSTDSTWKASGSKAAKEATKDLEKKADTDVVFTEEGGRLIAAQVDQARKAQAVLKAMASTPPLRLLVNPNKFSVKSQKIVSDGNWTRNGPVIEFWGDDQDKISGSGQVAAFYSVKTNPTLGEGGPGLSRAARNHSQAWQNIQSLWLLYKNNGALYLQNLSQEERDYVLSTVGSIYILYDNILYIGSFDSFNLSETDTKPFTAEYSFEFTVRAAFMLEFPNDFNYGAPVTLTERRAAIPVERSTYDRESGGAVGLPGAVSLPPENRSTGTSASQQESASDG